MADVMTKFKRDELLPESETVLTERIRLVLNPMEGGWPMKKSKFTERQIAFALHRQKAGHRLPRCAGKWASPKRRSIAGNSSTAA
jgi:hypothetical protein